MIEKSTKFGRKVLTNHTISIILNNVVKIRYGFMLTFKEFCINKLV